MVMLHYTAMFLLAFMFIRSKNVINTISWINLAAIANINSSLKFQATLCYVICALDPSSGICICHIVK
jgi:hypothetical protein